MAKKKSNRYLRLTSVGFQMGVIVFLAAQLGKYLDSIYPSSKKWFTICLVLLGVGIGLYSMLRQLNEINKEEDDDKEQP